MTPYWYKLLEKKARQGGTGFTIPYLIGAPTCLNNPVEFNINTLLNEVAENQIGEVMLRYCNTTRDFIMTISSSFILGKSYYKHTQFGNLLVVTEKNLKGLDHLNHIICSFEIDYQNSIDAGNFSIVNGEAQKYSPEDLSFITQCIKSN